MKNLLFFLLVAVGLFSCGEGAEVFTQSNESGTFSTANGSDKSGSGNSGQTLSGSYAKILKINNNIYAIDKSNLTTFAIKENGVDKIDVQDVGFNIENLFNHQDLLFIGSQSGMFIYQISESGIPKKKAQENYFSLPGIRFCDPVIADSEYAYVTLMTTTEGACRRRFQINELRIYDVRNITSPLLISTTQMEGPKGIGVKGNLLYVCDGENGLKVMDISDKTHPKVINTIEGFKAFDLIINGNKLSVIGEDKLKQYDITDPENIIEYSTILFT